MKTITKRICALILALQASLLMPLQARAGTMDLIDDILDAMGMVQPWPFNPVKPEDLKSFIHLVDTCQGIDDANLMACAEAGADDPTISGAVGSDISENLTTFVNIYVDIKNGDYLQLIIDAGEVVGCAAATVMAGGFDVCGTIKALIAVGEALVDVVGEVGDAAENWFRELDTAFDDLTGQTVGALDPAAYYQNWFMPYTRDFVSQFFVGGVTNDSILSPYVVFYAGGPQLYQDFGLAGISVNGMHAKCMEYYNDKHMGDQAATICDTLRAQFSNRTSFMIGASKQMTAFAGMAPPLLAAYQAGFRFQIKQFDESHGTNIEDKTVSGNDWYLSQLKYLTGAPHQYTWCAQAANNECFDSWSGAPSSSVAGRALNAVTASNFTLSPKLALDNAMSEVRPQLQKVVDNYKKTQLDAAQTKLKQARESTMFALLSDASTKLYGLRQACLSMSGKFNKSDYTNNCLDTQSLQSCKTYHSSFYNNGYVIYTQVDYTNAAAFDSYYATAEQKLATCIAQSKKIVDEYLRVSALSEPFQQGWIEACKQKANQRGYCEKNGPFPLGIAYDGCVKLAIAKASPGGELIFSLIDFSKVNKTIAEGFCSPQGAAVVDSLVASKGKGVFVPDPQRPQPVDISKRDPAQIALMAKIKEQNTSCSYSQTPKGQDVFKLVCTNKAAFDGCLSNFPGLQEERMARNCQPGLGDQNGFVDHPCCVLAPGRLPNAGAIITPTTPIQVPRGGASSPALHVITMEQQLKDAACLPVRGRAIAYQCQGTTGLQLCAAFQREGKVAECRQGR
jgi:hypothetical protein